MKCDELIEKIKQADDDYRHKFIPINLDIEIEDVLGAFEELKQKLHDAEMAKDLAEAANTEYRLDIEKLKEELVLGKEVYTRVRNEKMAMFDELSKVKFENERLKAKVDKLHLPEVSRDA